MNPWSPVRNRPPITRKHPATRTRYCLRRSSESIRTSQHGWRWPRLDPSPATRRSRCTVMWTHARFSRTTRTSRTIRATILWPRGGRRRLCPLPCRSSDPLRLTCTAMPEAMACSWTTRWTSCIPVEWWGGVTGEDQNSGKPKMTEPK